ncbi:MAG: hypothetical protein Q8940_07335 [Bacteroidota bacterium]|nr:hypothetical protein [Bacteroidota bacterium]
MRTFRINRGRYSGEHAIYASKEEFLQEHPDKEIKSPWYSLDTRALDWCESDDGFVVQCLYVRLMTNRFGQITYTYRFPTGLYYAWETKKGRKAKLFYASQTRKFRDSMSDHGNESFRVNQFILFVNAGMSVYEAYKKAFNHYGFIDSNALIGRINYMMIKYEDRLVEGLKTFMQRLDDKIRELSGQEPEDVIVDKIASMLVDTPASNSRELRENIKMYLQLKNAALRNSNKSLSSSEYAIQEDEKPPLLEE